MQSNTYKAPIYKAVVVSFGIMLVGQYARYTAHALTPEPAVYEQSLEVAAIEAQDSVLMAALLGMPEPDVNAAIDARQPLVLPVGIPPIPTHKPTGDL